MTSSGSDSQFYIPPNDQLSPQAFQMTVGEWHLDAQKEAVALGRDSQKIEAIRSQHSGELERLFGKRKYSLFRAYVAKEEERLAQELRFPKGPELSDAAKKKLKDGRRAKISAYLKRLRIDEREIKKISARYRKRFARADRGGVPSGVKVQEPLPISKVPKNVRLGKTNPWTRFEPPYPGWSWSYSWSSSGFNWAYTPSNHFFAPGWVENGVSFGIVWPPGDDDWAYGKYNTEYGFWYQTERSGPIEAYVEAEARSNSHYLWLDNRAGWSDSDMTQNQYLTMRIGGARSLCRVSYFYRYGYTDGYWHEGYWPTGAITWAHLVSPDTYPAGAWVFVWIGLRNYESCWADDVDALSTVLGTWNIKSVTIR